MLDKLFNTINAPSVQYIIFNKDSIIYYHVSGYAKTGIQKADNNTSYNLHSLSETFTALAVLQLAADDKLQLNEPIIKYFPDFSFDNHITIYDLLAHSSGIKDPEGIDWYHSAEIHRLFDEKNFCSEIINEIPARVPKREKKYCRSNTGYLLLGKLIERVSFYSYEEYISKNILQKLQPYGILFPHTNTLPAATGYQKTFSLSTLSPDYLFDKERTRGELKSYWKPIDIYYTNNPSVNSLAATAHGLAAYLKEFIKKDSKLIPGNYKSLFLESSRLNSKKNTYGNIGWIKGKLRDFDYFSYAGTGEGYYSEARIYPEAGLGSLILLNRTGLKEEKLLDRTDLYFLKTYNPHIEPDIYAEANIMA